MVAKLTLVKLMLALSFLLLAATAVYATWPSGSTYGRICLSGQQPSYLGNLSCALIFVTNGGL